jgi:phospholipase C
MRKTAAGLFWMLLLPGVMLAQTRVSAFHHVVLVVQENRTPDDLFQGLCLPPYGNPNACGSGVGQFDIQGYGYDRNGNKVALAPVPLGNPYDPPHNHGTFEAMCNPNGVTFYPCSRNTRLPTAGCPANCSFEFVDPTTTPTIYPYLYMAQNFGWANRMLQTNQGPSAPAHQFLFAGTSAPSAADDAAAVFVTENPSSGLGCLAALDGVYSLIDPARAPQEYGLVNNPLGTTCFSHETMASLLEQNHHHWRYYTPGVVKTHTSGSIWTAPNWIQEICQPNSTFTACTGTEWLNNVDMDPADVLRDLQNCKLADMVWVIPKGQNSDHPSGRASVSNDGGPAWVANVVNGVSSSGCVDEVNGQAVPYWEDTAIVVTWDDWGGFYDHVLPPFLSAPNQGQGDYQLGFRVPLLFISAYTNPTIDNTNRYDFGSILRFAEHNFGMQEGVLGFADQRASTDLRGFYSFSHPPKKFHIPTNVPASFFLNDMRPAEPPDID